MTSSANDLYGSNDLYEMLTKPAAEAGYILVRQDVTTLGRSEWISFRDPIEVIHAGIDQDRQSPNKIWLRLFKTTVDTYGNYLQPVYQFDLTKEEDSKALLKAITSNFNHIER